MCCVSNFHVERSHRLTLVSSALSATLSAALSACFTGGFCVIRQRLIGSSIAGLRCRFSGRLAGGLPFSSYIIVEAVKAFGFGTVKVKPPITDKVSFKINKSME